MDINETLKQLIRWGEIVSVLPNNTARVQFSDIDNIVSHDLRILVPNANKNKYQAPPDVGCNALCIMMPTGDSDGFIVGTFYNEKNTAPIESLDHVMHWTFEDGTVLNYDKSSSTLTADVKGPIDITTTDTAMVKATTKATIDCPDIQLIGDVTITGDLTVISGGAIVAQITKENMAITGKIKSTNDIDITDGNLTVTGNVNATGSVTGSNL